MPMSNKGLTKLVEECGELIQVAAKLIAYPDGDHPDRAGGLFMRLEEELGDVLAACRFVSTKLWEVNFQSIDERAKSKFLQYQKWDKEEEEV